jgi:protein phosphatase
VITRALGPEARVDVDTRTHRARPGDVLLLCSDGLTSMVPEARIAEILGGQSSLEAAGRALIDEANERGGRDNITVVLLRLEEVAAASAGAPDQPTEVGAMTTADLEAAAATRAEPAPERTGSGVRRRPAPAPAPAPRRQRVRGAIPTIVVLGLLALLLGGAWIATRAVYFVGTDSQGFVAVYRGLPYDAPAGIRLYERTYASGVPAASLPATRRRALLDHRLRSQDDADDLMRKLELGRVR